MNIKIVGPQNFGFENIGFPKALEWLKSLEIIDFDSENDIPTQRLLCIQLGNSEQQIIFTERFELLKEILETKTLRIQNALHDLRLLYKIGIFPEHIRDTFLQEMILNCGKHKLGISLKNAGLAVIAEKYCGVTLDKSPRKNPELSRAFIEYAARDIIYLEKIDTEQRRFAASLDLFEVFNLENQYVKALAYITDCGFKLEKEGFRKKCEKEILELQQLEIDLKKTVIAEPKLKKWVSWTSDLFETPTQNLDFTWSQTSKVQEVFETLGFVWIEKDKKKLDARLIKKDKGKHPLIDLYLKYSGLANRVSTFGMNVLEVLGPDDRLRSNFIQIISTGRQSSRGEDENSDLKGINLQNIPKWSEERKYFTCDRDNVMVIGDYAGQETRILAEFAQDPKFEEYISDPEKDLHSFMVHRIWPEYRKYTHKEIMANHSRKRSDAKPGWFSIPYGGVGFTLSRNLDISLEEGERVYKEVMEEFPGLSKYFEKVTREALRLGYILVNKTTRRKIFLHNHQLYRKINFIKNQDSQQWKWCRQYENEKGRLARNYPIQSTGSDQLKTATCLLFDLIKKNKLINIVKINNVVHDEIDTECPKELAVKTAKALEQCMMVAGQKFLKKIPIKVDIRTSKFWKEDER